MSNPFEIHRRALLEMLGFLAGQLDPTRAQNTAGRSAPKMIDSALERISQRFKLTDFEHYLLAAAAGVQIDAPFAQSLSRRGGEGPLSFGSMMSLLPDLAHWTALTPDRPLRKWRLVELAANRPAIHAPLSIDEHVLDHLLGLDGIDPRTPITRAEGEKEDADDSLLELLSHVDLRSVIVLSGTAESGKIYVAASTLLRLGSSLFVLRADEIPAASPERRELAVLISRELLLHGAAIFIDADREPNEEVLRRVAGFVDNLEGPTLIGTRDVIRTSDRPVLSFQLKKPTRSQQTRVWCGALGEGLDEAASAKLTAQFDLSVGAINEAAHHARATQGEDLAKAAWNACRWASRRGLDDLAQRIEPRAKMGDLILPELQLESLRDLVQHVRYRADVLDGWGFAERSQRGLGNSALFHGPSGTGKTTAAEILAGELDLDLYRVDLSAIVSKYIGETEKNLRRVFDAADAGAAILLFDEADALFGRRTEQLRDSHDRYANLEVSYLLQRMESYRGLAILTTNLKSAMDEAFLRRIRFSVSFPFPGPADRERMWRSAFPKKTPVATLDYLRLAQLTITGGNIANIAMNAAFLAAAESAARVEMTHVLRATRREYAKLERPFTAAETKGLL